MMFQQISVVYHHCIGDIGITALSEGHWCVVHLLRLITAEESEKSVPQFRPEVQISVNTSRCALAESWC